MNGKFQNIIKSSKPVLVDFYTDWCGPCKQVPPILQQVKSDLKEKVRIIKVNVDRNPFIASEYQIKSVPTLIIFQDGVPKWTGVGVRNATELKDIIENIL